MYSLQLVDKRTTPEREESDTKVLTTAKIPEDLLEEVDLLAKRRGMYRSEIIREALEKALLQGLPVKAPPRSGVLRVVSFKIDKELLDRVDDLARSRRMSRSEVVRRALEVWEGLVIRNSPVAVRG